MSKIGAIVDLNYTRHHLFHSYYYALKNLYKDVVVVKNMDDLKGVEILFICDDHHHPNKTIWRNEYMFAYCKINRIKVVGLTNERILNSFFPWNTTYLKELDKFGKENLYHYAIDVDDCRKLGLKLHRTPPSICFPKFNKVEKQNKMVFVGKISCPNNSYKTRKEVLKLASKSIEIDIIEKPIERWEDYLQLIASYKFVFSPIGNGNFFPMRFYEALLVDSIPVHQVLDNTLELYDLEARMNGAIFFKQVDELPEKLKNPITCKSDPIYMEDVLAINLKQDKLL